MTNKALNKLKKAFKEFLADECYDLTMYKEGKYDDKIWRWINKHFIPREEKMTVIHNPITDTYYKIKTKRVNGNSKGSIVRKWKQFKEKK